MAFLLPVIEGFLDYCGYNWSVNTGWKTFYRILQVIMHLTCFAIAWQTSLSVFFIYLILVLGWWRDLVYYACYHFFRWFGDPSYNAYEHEVLGDRVIWAWGSLYGILFRLLPGIKHVPIPGRILVIQAQLALLLAIGLQVGDYLYR